MSMTTKKHTIASGDTFYGLANKYDTDVETLDSLNPGVDYSQLSIGQEVNVPVQPIGEQLIAEGEKFLGTPYDFGEEGPNSFDCSGFTQYIYEQVTGIDLPRTASGQSEVGIDIPEGERQKGDLIFWEGTRSKDLNHNNVTHIAMYVDEDEFLGAQGSTGVAYADINRDYWQQRYVGAKRIVDDQGRKLPRQGEEGDLLKVVAETVNYRSSASWENDAVAGKVKQDEVFTIKRRVDMGSDTDLYELISGTYITTHPNYVRLT